MTNCDLLNIIKNINKESCPTIVNFHCHTKHSDGSMTPEELLEKANDLNLQYLSITDHHSVEALKYINKKSLLKKFRYRFRLISGIEINCLLKGCLVHLIGLGIDINSESIKPYIQGESPIGSNLRVEAVAKSIKDSGGISFLAHPARYRLPYGELISEAFKVGIDGVEVWYDYSFNERWEPSYFICEKIDELTDSYGMLKTCGTDSHGYSLFGR